MDEWGNKVQCTYSGILYSLMKGGNPSICNNMNEPGEYAKWNKLDIER